MDPMHAPRTQPEIRERHQQFVQRQWEGELEMKREEREAAAAAREREADANAALAEKLAKGPLEPSEPETPAGPETVEIPSEGGHALTLPEIPPDLVDGKLDEVKVGEYAGLAKDVGLSQEHSQAFLDTFTQVRVTERGALPTERQGVSTYLLGRIGADGIEALGRTYDALPERARAWLDDLAANGDARDIAAVSVALHLYAQGLHRLSPDEAAATLDEITTADPATSVTDRDHRASVDVMRFLGQIVHAERKPAKQGTITTPKTITSSPEQDFDARVRALQQQAMAEKDSRKRAALVEQISRLYQERYPAGG